MKILIVHTFMGYYSQIIAFFHKKNMTTVFDEYFKQWEKGLGYDSRALLSPSNIVELLALCKALGEDEMRSDDAEKNSVKKYKRS